MTASEYILIGRKPNGDKVYVQARLEYASQVLWRTQTDHTQTTERLRFALGGAIIGKYGSIDSDRGWWVGGGQTRDDLLELSSLADGWTVADVIKLHGIWEEWHLNDMNAGCDHQTQGQDSPPCRVTGYKYGSAWLFKSLPYKVFEFICTRFDIEPPEPGTAPERRLDSFGDPLTNWQR